MWKREVGSLRVYEGHAQILVNPIDTLVVANVNPVRSGDEIQRFLVSQTNILQSDSVLQKLIEKRGPINPASDEVPTDVLQQFKDRITEFFYGDDKYFRAQGPESETQTAIINFRLRSMVRPDLGGNTIKLLVYGTDREIIKNELTSWINAYIKHVEEISREIQESYLTERIQVYKQLEGTALGELDAFRKESPDVNSETQGFINQEIGRLQSQQDEIRRRLAFGSSAESSSLTGVPDPDAEELRKLNRELVSLLSTGYDENNVQVKQIRKSIALVEARKTAAPETKQGGGGPDQKIKTAQEVLTDSMNALLRRNAELKEKLKLRQDLEDNYKQHKEKRQQYELRLQEAKDQLASKKSVQIQVADRPTVSAEPFEYHPLRKLAQGLAAGAVVGLFVALLLEIFQTRIRFTGDVVHDVGLSVVAVVPKR